MKAAGIIAEYNPFHAGHAWHIAQTRARGATHIVAVMSGYTVQRGEFAIMSKQARARAALENGVDLVLCLPTPWSCARAQDFARAGVHLLNALGCVELLSFGSECGDLSLLQRAAAGLREREVENSLRERIGQGSAFASARQAALAAVDPKASALLRSPNDTLAVEYLQALESLRAQIAPIAVPRRGYGHDKLQETRDKRQDSDFRNAKELRIIFRESGLTSHNVSLGQCPALPILQEEALHGRAPADMRRLEAAWLARLRCMTVEEITRLPDISEGMEHRLHRAIRQGTSVAEILALAGSKRVPTARLRRVLFHTLLRVTAEDVAGPPRFIQVIGHNAAGRELLHRAKATAFLPIVTRTADIKPLDAQAKQAFALECRAADLMALAMPCPLPCGTEERRQVIVI